MVTIGTRIMKKDLKDMTSDEMLITPSDICMIKKTPDMNENSAIATYPVGFLKKERNSLLNIADIYYPPLINL